MHYFKPLDTFLGTQWHKISQKDPRQWVLVLATTHGRGHTGGRTAKSRGTAAGGTAAKHREGHPWGSREDDNIIEETLNEHISKFCPLAPAVSLGSCQ